MIPAVNPLCLYGNYEPILVLIGFIFTTSEIFRRRYSETKPRSESKLKNQNANETRQIINPDNKSSDQNEKIDHNESDQAKIKEITSKNIHDSSTSLTVDNILNSLNRKTFTQLQISQFVKRTTGLELTCTMKVHDITPAFKRDPQSDLYLVCSLESQKDNPLPEIIVTTFDRSKEVDLAALSEGYIVTIKGKISFTELPGEYSLSLKECELLTFQKALNKANAADTKSRAAD